MSYQTETFEDRVVRLLGKELRNPEKVLSRLSSEQREQPQPRNCDPELQTGSLASTLTATQRAACAVLALPKFEEEARRRQLAGLQQFADTVPANLQERGEASEFAAKELGIGTRYVYELKAIKENYPELFWECHAGAE